MTERGRWHRSPVVGVLCWALVTPAAGWAAIRMFGLERGPLVQLLAFTPYAAVAALVPLAVTLLTRRWWAAAVAAVAVAALAVAVVPRAFPTDRAPDPAAGPVVRVLTANLLAGAAEPAALVALVRDHEVDLLALQELTPDAERRLDRAGLADLLPYRDTSPVRGSAGSAVYSRFPLSGEGVRTNAGGFRQAYATVAVPDATPVRFESVHPCAPHTPTRLRCWWTDLEDQPPATPNGPVQILAGDFNATLDHVALRRLISTGYRDAAAAVGDGLAPTWGPYAHRPVPPVTIDRVLVDRRVGVLSTSVHQLPDSDHRAVLAELVLPPSG